MTTFEREYPEVGKGLLEGGNGEEKMVKLIKIILKNRVHLSTHPLAGLSIHSRALYQGSAFTGLDLGILLEAPQPVEMGLWRCCAQKLIFPLTSQHRVDGISLKVITPFCTP